MNIVIVGTAHVSRRSVEDVLRVIEEVRPDAVAVELDERRFLALTGGYRDISIEEVVKGGSVFPVLLQLFLSYVQKKIGERYEVKPGEEMLAAIEKAREIGADVVLIDRDIGITFRRFWESLSVVEKIKLLFHILKDVLSGEEMDVDEIVKEDVVDALVREFRKISPSAARVLIDERDAYMAHMLIEASKRYERIVAVVGAGHKKGIERYLKNPSSLPSLSELVEVRRRKVSAFKLLGMAITALVILTFAAVISTMNSQIVMRAFLYWFLINGFLSALFAILAGAHPLSALSAFLCAWLTSLNPFVAAGWISGIVEAKIRRPSYRDLEELSEARSLRDLLRNRIFRVLLVAAATNVGSMIGTIYGAYVIINMTGVNVPELIREGISRILR